MPKQQKPPESARDQNPGVLKQFLSDWRDARKRNRGIIRGTVAQQKDMAVTERQAQFMTEAKTALRTVRSLKVQPSRVETFEEAVARLKLSPEFLQSQMQRHKWVHLALYLMAGALLTYTVWLFMNRSGFLAIGTLSASIAVAVNGYIHGYRAWQIEHRNFIRLQDAIRIPSTYLVL